jgi:hypothetical protein
MINRQEEVRMEAGTTGVRREFAQLRDLIAQMMTGLLGEDEGWRLWFSRLMAHLEEGEKLWNEQNTAQAEEWVELSVGDGWHRVSPDGEKWQYRLTEDHPWVSGEGADWLSPSVKAYRKGYEVGKQEQQRWGGQGELWGELEEHFDLDGEDMDCAGDVAHWIITNVPSAEERAKLLDRIEDKEDTIEALRRNVKTYSDLLVAEKNKVVAAEKERAKVGSWWRQ